MRDELFLYVGARRMQGWTSIRVTRGIERCPSDFEIEMTELYPNDVGATVVRPGDYCEVRLGTAEKNDLVLSGYVDRYAPSIGPGYHTVRVSGRGKCQDLIDCSAEWPNGQISSSTVLLIAKKLALPYGQPDNPITVRTDVEDPGPVIPQMNLQLGQSAYSVIEEICRYAAFLVYEEPDGNLLLTRTGNKRSESGFYQAIEGDTSSNNVQSASINYSMDGRYSSVFCWMQSLDTFSDLGEGGNLIAEVNDPNVPRHRRLYVIAEAGDTNHEVAKRRAVWEVSRRYGRSAQLKLTTDSWRDASGALWEPNTLVPLFLPALKVSNVSWLISEVSFKRDAYDGTTAEITIMPPEAFEPKPIVLMPMFSDVPDLRPTR